MHAITLSFPLLFWSTTALHVPSCADTHRNISDYPHAHSYTPVYSFDRRDGWETVPVSDLEYKYSWDYSNEDASSALDNPHGLQRRSRAHQGQRGQGNSIGGSIKDVVGATLKGIGKIELVTITWYTGKDLLNPSCWSKSVWAPTDKSFACAVTQEGWVNRPGCFKFLELCNGTKKCIFARVVDTCAGCAKGSKHVDLTKAAFQALASLDQGTLQVKMRLATDPKDWHEDLWGPKHV